MRNVSKNVFLNALTCPVLGWMLRTGEAPKPRLTLGDRFRFEQGREIGRRARILYPDGLIVADVNLSSAVRKTNDALSSSVPAIFEGAFLADGFVTRADVLEREAEGWHLIEVKSGANDRVEYIDDMAHTYMVADSCGLKIGGVSLLLVSRDFRLGMADDALFVRIDHIDDVFARVEELKNIRREIEEITRAPDKPEPQLITECRNCDLFRQCVGKGIENHIFDLPRLSQTRFDELVEQGIVRIEDIPDGFDLTESQARVKDCVQRGESYIGEGLRKELETIKWPAYYLDFETTMTAIPLYPDIAPYTQLPTQYSVHVCSDVGMVIEHCEYLADPAWDCRRELAENLLHDLGEQGSIITYSSFERAIINGLAQLFPDLSDALGATRERIVDLEAIIRRNYYHPDFHGSTSIKMTLPALVPGMSYRGMQISEGDSASAAFAYLAMGIHWKPNDVEEVKHNLLKYCEQDTLAMVKLHEKLADVVKP
jgi:hypothetical protein